MAGVSSREPMPTHTPSEALRVVGHGLGDDRAGRWAARSGAVDAVFIARAAGSGW